VSEFRDRIYPCSVVSATATNAAGTVILNGNPINPALAFRAPELL